MPNFEFRFDIASVLLGSVLTALGISSVHAAGKGGHVGEVLFCGPLATDVAPQGEGGGGSEVNAAHVLLVGVKGGHSGEVSCRGGSRGAQAAVILAGGKGGAQGGDVRSRGWFGSGQ